MPEALSMNDCWNKIGVWGNADCPELEKYVHCRNCPVYSTAATQLLNIAPPHHYLEEWSSFVAGERETREPNIHSAIIFCIESEWLALSTKVFQEVAELKTIHSLPRRHAGVVLGIVNIRGELLICISIARALSLEKTRETSREKNQGTRQRLLVINDEGKRLVFPVDEVGGIHHFNPKEKKEVPATIAKAAAVHTTGVLSWRNKSVGCLDEQLLLYTLNKGLS